MNETEKTKMSPAPSQTESASSPQAPSTSSPSAQGKTSRSAQAQSSPSAQATSSAPTDVPQRQAVPEIIREAQGDLADRAEIEIEQEIQEQIMNIRKRLPRSDSQQPS